MLLLNLAELLLLANCWKANKIWSASIVTRCLYCWFVAYLLSTFSFVSLKNSQLSKNDFLPERLSPCHRSRLSHKLVFFGSERPLLQTKITLEVVLIRYLFQVKRVSGCLRSRSRVAFEQWVHKKLINSGKSTYNAVLRPTELLPKLLGCSTFYLLGDLSNKILFCDGNTCVLCQVAPGILVTILLVKGSKFSLVSQSCYWKQLTVVKIDLSFLSSNENLGCNKWERSSFSQTVNVNTKSCSE